MAKEALGSVAFRLMASALLSWVRSTRINVAAFRNVSSRTIARRRYYWCDCDWTGKDFPRQIWFNPIPAEAREKNNTLRYMGATVQSWIAECPRVLLQLTHKNGTLESDPCPSYRALMLRQKSWWRQDIEGVKVPHSLSTPELMDLKYGQRCTARQLAHMIMYTTNWTNGLTIIWKLCGPFWALTSYFGSATKEKLGIAKDTCSNILSRLSRKKNCKE